MGKTFRNIKYCNRFRNPKYKHKLLEGDSKGDIVTDYDDKPVAARKEGKYNKEKE